jgi:MYXO-CTERM domain-containing protein
VGGSLECLDGRGPTVEICDGLDNDCNGEADETAECPGENLCVEGKCAERCGSGEFPCPNGLVCINDFCLASSGTGGTGNTDGGAGNSEGGAGPNENGGAAGDGTGGTSRPSGSGNTPGQGPTEEHDWGLATGGGGVSCIFGRVPSSGAGLLFGLVGLTWLTRRRRRREAARGGRVS